MQLKFYIILFLLSTVSINAFSQEKKHHVLTAQWPKYTNPNGTGFYFEFLDLIYGNKSYTYKLTPWKRAQIDFKNGKADILLGEGELNESCHRPKYPMDIDIFAMFYSNEKFKDKPILQNLNKTKVIWVRGYDIAKYSGLTPYEEVDDLDVGIKKIISGQADVLIDYEGDIQSQLKALKINKKTFVVASAEFKGGTINVCFKKNENSIKQVQFYENKIEEIRKNGSLEKLYKKFGLSERYKIIYNK